jgi:hypothetical protein
MSPTASHRQKKNQGNLSIVRSDQLKPNERPKAVADTNKKAAVIGLVALFALVLVGVLVGSGSHVGSRASALNRVPDSLAQQPEPVNQQDVAATRRSLLARFPSVDYDGPEPSDPAEKAKRRKRSKHYDGRQLVMENPSPSGTATVVDSEVFFDLPALPIDESDLILIGDILSSDAHLSNDKSAVYSEFGVQVSEVLRGSVSNQGIVVSRIGGVVRYRSGHSERYQIAGQNMPALRERYLLFLKQTGDPQAFEMITAYEINLARVVPLDYGSQFQGFSGTDPTSFLKTIRDAIDKKR